MSTETIAPLSSSLAISRLASGLDEGVVVEVQAPPRCEVARGRVAPHDLALRVRRRGCGCCRGRRSAGSRAGPGACAARLVGADARADARAARSPKPRDRERARAPPLASAAGLGVRTTTLRTRGVSASIGALRARALLRRRAPACARRRDARRRRRAAAGASRRRVTRAEPWDRSRGSPRVCPPLSCSRPPTR